jgi:flagellum-specific peptidoglycan hydrolase FlgJ
MKKTIILSLGVLITCRLAAQNSPDVTGYISTYKDIAIREMQRTGVPASITLAQGILESQSGNSELTQLSNNHFGIKCKKNWTGETVLHDDDQRKECFRKYSSAEDSYRDHSDFLRANDRYASLFSLDPLDYSGWAYGLKQAGYATESNYPQALVKLIEDYHLQDYSLQALGKKPDPDSTSSTRSASGQKPQ